MKDFEQIRSDFICKFTDYHGDILTSDREVATFGFIIMDMIGE